MDIQTIAATAGVGPGTLREYRPLASIKPVERQEFISVKSVELLRTNRPNAQPVFYNRSGLLDPSWQIRKSIEEAEQINALQMRNDRRALLDKLH